MALANLIPLDDFVSGLASRGSSIGDLTCSPEVVNTGGTASVSEHNNIEWKKPTELKWRQKAQKQRVRVTLKRHYSVDASKVRGWAPKVLMCQAIRGLKNLTIETN